ncbi:MAG: UvrD-helicase domain-containing protein [Erysipelotrichaceae bacterium]|nr:UvrD-helicase domain-containing protein [Erysipelotrichaceae bacterium]
MEKWTKQQIDAYSHFGHNIIVSAGAGSGKTAVLSERVYRHVGERKIDIDRLLVLTFTNKAAAEMKKRIRDKIVKDEAHLFSSDEEKRRQINKIDSSFIMTFDAYALSLIKKYHYLLDLDYDISVIDKNILDIRYKKELDEIMNEEYRKKDPGFLNLIETFCTRNDDSIRRTVISLNYKLDAIYERDEYVKDYYDKRCSNETIDSYIEGYTQILEEKIRVLRSGINELAYYVENVEEYYPGINQLLQAKGYEDIRNCALSCEVSKKRLPNNSGAGDIKKKVSEDLKKLKELTSDDLKSIKEQTLSSADFELVLLELAQKLNQRMCVFKSENKMYAFNDIFKMAIELVDRFEDVRKEISESFTEILIDEYQDTNDLQDEFISRIAHDNVYMVGDVKQSIYRFRNANPKLFMQKYQDYSADDNNDELLELPHNFRSRHEIIEDINVIFDRVMDLKIGGADFRKSHHMEAGRNDEDILHQNNHLEILIYSFNKNEEPFIGFDKKELEAFIMARDIKEKVNKYLVRDYKDNKEILRPATYRDFCIIVDRTTNFDLYKQILTYFKIPAIIEKDEEMTDSDLISVFRAIFTLLEHIADDNLDYDFRFAYLSLARSFLVEMKDQDIYEIFKNDSFKETDLYKRLLSVSEGIEEKTIGKILEEIIKEFDIYERIRRIGDIDENMIKIDYLYQLSHTLNATSYDYRQFNEYLEGVFEESDDKDISYNIDPGDPDAVRIINTHKAKGLQYKICYFPALDVKFNESDIKNRFAFSRDIGVITPVMIENRGIKDSIRKTLFVQETLKEDIGERLRLLYVALTRSEEKIIMICPIKKESREGEIIADEDRLSFSCFKDVLDSVSDDLEERGFISDYDAESLNLTKDYRLLENIDLRKVINRQGERISVREPVHIEPEIIERRHYSKDSGLIDEVTIAKMELGTKLHYYLETLDLKDPDYEDIEDRYQGYIRSFVECEIMKDVKSAKVYKEYEFIYEDGNEKKHGFIDLLLEYDDHFVIIDYKTRNIDDPHYDEQLNGYRKYLESISSKTVCCYLYSLMDSRYREVR